MKLLECVRNKIKYQKKKYGILDTTSTSKGKRKGKAGSKKLRLDYAVQNCGQLSSSCAQSSIKELKEAIHIEMSHETPREDVLKPLMTATFNERHVEISVKPISESLKEFPPLRLPIFVSSFFIC